MKTIQISNEPYLFRLVPDTAVERMLLGRIVATEVSQHREHIQLPHNPDHTAEWEAARHADNNGFIPASVIIRRPFSGEASDTFSRIFAGNSKEEVARVAATMFVVINDPDSPEDMDVMYEIPKSEWTSPQGSSNYIHYPPILYQSPKEESTTAKKK
jgi:hypothetical protein